MGTGEATGAVSACETASGIVIILAAANKTTSGVVVVVVTSTSKASASGTGGTSGARMVVMTWQYLLNSCGKLLVIWSRSTIIFFVCVALAAGKETSRSLEFIKGLHGQSRHAVVGGLSMVDFVDWDGSVDNLGLDGLLVDYGLDSLVDMVMDMLTSDSRGSLLGGGGASSGRGVLESGKLSAYSSSGLFLIVMTELFLDLRDEVMGVLLWKNFSVLNWLNGGVVVILVDFPVNGLSGLFMSVRLDGL